MKRFLRLAIILSVLLIGAIGCSTKGKATQQIYMAEQENRKYVIDVKVNVAWMNSDVNKDDHYCFYINELPVVVGDTLMIKDAYRHGLVVPEMKLLIQKNFVSCSITSQ